MDPNKLLGTTFNCECGRSHEVPTRKLIYADDALEQLPEVLGALVEGRDAVLVADERTRDVAGQAVEILLDRAGWAVRQIVVPDFSGCSPSCDDATHHWLGGYLGGHNQDLSPSHSKT